MNLCEIINNLRSEDDEKILAVLNTASHSGSGEGYIALHTGFYCKTQSGRPIEFLYDFRLRILSFQYAYGGILRYSLGFIFQMSDPQPRFGSMEFHFRPLTIDENKHYVCTCLDDDKGEIKDKKIVISPASIPLILKIKSKSLYEDISVSYRYSVKKYNYFNGKWCM
jgi:hypothetical protein